MFLNDKLYEDVNNYTKYKLVEMLIEKHQDCKLNNLNEIEEVADDILIILATCGMKFYSELNTEFDNK